MDLDNFDVGIYSQNAFEMLEGSTIIIVEGMANKLFYRKFEEISHISILTPLELIDKGLTSSENGSSSCSVIKKLIIENESFYGIIDRDFTNKDLSKRNLFVLDYYSLENIVLLEHKKFEKIKSELIFFLDGKKLNEYKIKLYTLGDIRYGKDSVSYNIKELKEVHNDVHSYIKNTITDVNCYLKYISVKKLIEKFDGCLPCLIKHHQKYKYFEELYDELKDKNILNLFPQTQHQAIMAICKNIDSNNKSLIV